MTRAMERLDSCAGAPVSLTELAAESGVSPYQLLRAFKRTLGITPHVYLTQKRVQIARRCLAEGRRPAETAFQSGFADQSHLTRAFKRYIGVTPGQYRAAVT